MKEVFVNHSINYLIKNDACQEKDIQIFRYTLESLYSLFTKTSVVLLLAIFFNVFKITILIMLFYSILRGFSFGIHATKNIYCWITTLSVYLIGSLLVKFLFIPNIYIYLIYFISFLFILFWAPADTPARPLLNQKKRMTNKIISIILISIYILFSFFIRYENIKEIVAIVLFLEAICVCPITYKIFHVPYNNYKSYKR